MKPRAIDVSHLPDYAFGHRNLMWWGGTSLMLIEGMMFALLFVIFDVEAVFLFPWAASVERYGWFGLVTMLIFIVLLLDGLVYAWKRGLLRWV